MDDVPLYATVLYDVRRKLDISFNEYVYLDMVYHLSYSRWCTKSIDNSASDMGLSRRGMITMRERLIERGLLRKNIKGHLKVTDTYVNAGVQKVHRGVQKVHFASAQSAPKNNNRNTENSGMSAQELLKRKYTPKATVLPSYVVERHK